MLTFFAILGMLFAGWLFWNDYVIAGIFMFLASWLVWANDD